MIFYEKKISPAGKVSYVEHKEQSATLNLTEGECLTAAGSLAVVLLMIFERNIPPVPKDNHKFLIDRLQKLSDEQE